jgi:lipoprotein-anchoring transpeptidase ErfK/SrfK
MLWAVFFHGGMALHSSLDRDAIRDMGHAAASHGCVHLEDYRAEEMFHLIGQSGYGQVDQIDERSGKRTGKKVAAYKALIIIGPTTPWTPMIAPATITQSKAEPAVGNDPSTLSNDPAAQTDGSGSWIQP